MDEDAKRALKIAREKYGEGVSFASIGENDKYKVITLDNPDSTDAFDDYWLLINKKTGKELLGSGMIFDPIPGFEDFTYENLNYTY